MILTDEVKQSDREKIISHLIKYGYITHSIANKKYGISYNGFYVALNRIKKDYDVMTFDKRIYIKALHPFSDEMLTDFLLLDRHCDKLSTNLISYITGRTAKDIMRIYSDMVESGAVKIA